MLLTFFCAPVLGITQDEYAALMDTPAFARADKRINELWDEVQRIAPQSVLNFLKQAQTEWWEYDWDSRVASLIEDDKLPREAAYTKVTNERADDLQMLFKALTTPEKANNLIGEYVRTWDRGKVDTGWLTITWSNKKKSEVKLELFAVGGRMANYGTDLWAPNIGEWEGKAIVKNKVLAFTQDEPDDDIDAAYIILIFKDNNTVLIETTTDSLYYVGVGVTFDGEYKRRK